MNTYMKYRAMSAYSDVVLAVLVYVYAVEISINIVLMALNTDLALFWGWIVVPVAFGIMILGSLFAIILIVLLIYINMTRSNAPDDILSINKRFRFSFLYLLLIIGLYVFLGSGFKPCSDCNKFESYIKLSILEVLPDQSEEILMQEMKRKMERMKN